MWDFKNITAMRDDSYEPLYHLAPEKNIIQNMMQEPLVDLTQNDPADVPTSYEKKENME